MAEFLQTFKGTSIIRTVLLFLVSIFSLQATRAQDFVTDVMVIGGSKSETQSLRSSLQAQGWVFVDKDLNAGAGGDYIYLLYKDKFYLSQTGTIPENGVYLELQAEKSRSRGVLSIGDDGTTGIQQIENGVNIEKTGWYTLDGRRLEAAPTRKGLYINNGKKVVIK